MSDRNSFQDAFRISHPRVGESWHHPLYLPAPGTERSRQRESPGTRSWSWMEAGAGRQTLRGTGTGERERDGGRSPSSVHVQVSASAAGTRGEVPPAWQFCCGAVPLVRAWSRSVFSLSPLHRKLPLACLVRLRRGPEVSKRLARPRIKSPKPRPTSCW